jgi:predicted amidohydrolase
MTSTVRERGTFLNMGTVQVLKSKHFDTLFSLSLQEMWCCPYSTKSLRGHAEDIDAQSAPSISMLLEAASYHKITIIGGSIPEISGDKLFNTCCVLGADGKIKAKHRKVRVYLNY